MNLISEQTAAKFKKCGQGVVTLKVLNKKANILKLFKCKILITKAKWNTKIKAN